MWSKVCSFWNSPGVDKKWGGVSMFHRYLPSKPASFCHLVQSQNEPCRLRMCLPTPCLATIWLLAEYWHICALNLLTQTTWLKIRGVQLDQIVTLVDHEHSFDCCSSMLLWETGWIYLTGSRSHLSSSSPTWESSTTHQGFYQMPNSLCPLHIMNSASHHAHPHFPAGWTAWGIKQDCGYQKDRTNHY